MPKLRSGNYTVTPVVLTAVGAEGCDHYSRGVLCDVFVHELRHYSALCCRRAGLKGHIRKGQDSDLAYLAPTLIPVPGAFQADGSNPMVSHTAENILFKVKKEMILGDIG
jgi:hypothetical protein